MSFPPSGRSSGPRRRPPSSADPGSAERRVCTVAGKFLARGPAPGDDERAERWARMRRRILRAAGRDPEEDEPAGDDRHPADDGDDEDERARRSALAGTLRDCLLKARFPHLLGPDLEDSDDPAPPVAEEEGRGVGFPDVIQFEAPAFHDADVVGGDFYYGNATGDAAEPFYALPELAAPPLVAEPPFEVVASSQPDEDEADPGAFVRDSADGQEVVPSSQPEEHE